jgi:DNA-binding MarR family transcriptional regulator
MERADSRAVGSAYSAIARLRTLRTFERAHLPLLRTVGDQDLILEIGYHQGRRRPLTMKQALLFDLGSVATTQRRVRRLRPLGLVAQNRSPKDRRVQELRLSPRLLAVFAKYDEVLRAQEGG